VGSYIFISSTLIGRVVQASAEKRSWVQNPGRPECPSPCFVASSMTMVPTSHTTPRGVVPRGLETSYAYKATLV
jgi:hypothetical protein